MRREILSEQESEPCLVIVLVYKSHLLQIGLWTIFFVSVHFFGSSLCRNTSSNELITFGLTPCLVRLKEYTSRELTAPQLVDSADTKRQVSQSSLEEMDGMCFHRV